MMFPYSSQTTFMRARPAISPLGRVAAESAPFGLAGLPWDGSVTNRSGARHGPGAIRQASHMLCDGIHPFFDVSPLDHLQDHGDLVMPNTSLAAMRQAMLPQVRELIAQRHMVWLGGDHSVTLPLLQAYRERVGQPLALIHFDAHCDTWHDHFGEPSGHGTWLHEAFEQGLVRPECVVQIGIRSAAERGVRERVRTEGGLLYEARTLRGLEGAGQLSEVIEAVRQRMAASGHPPLYLTLDIDCLDPAHAPGTGTPEPAGLSTAQVMTLLEGWADLNFVGMDCVEVSPPYDHAELTSQAAAHFVWTYLSGRVLAGQSVQRG
jgi:agmatinase